MSSSDVVDIKTWIDARPISGYQWLILGLCFVAMLFDGYDAAVMGFVAPAMIKHWQMEPSAMGPILGAALIGIAIGAMVSGPIADRFGRKKVLLTCIAIFGVFGLLSGLAQSPFQMMALRFLTGLGLGAVMPNSVTLVAEFMPEQRRGVMITLMYAGFNVGSGAGGFVAAYLIQHFGWQAVLLVGGALPLLLLPLLVVCLPESALFMVLRGGSEPRLRRLLARLGGIFPADTRFVLNVPVLPKKAPFIQLFSKGYTRGTLALWGTYLAGAFTIYLLNGWLPTVLNHGGVSIERAAIVAGLFQLGGTVGALSVGALMDRLTGRYVIGAFYLAGAVLFFVQFAQGFTATALAALVFACGFCINGATTGLQALAPSFYPTEMRVTGVSWMQGIGRLGAIGSSIGGGLILTLLPGINSIFAVLAVPAALAGFSIFQHRKANVVRQLRSADQPGRA